MVLCQASSGESGRAWAEATDAQRMLIRPKKCFMYPSSDGGLEREWLGKYSCLWVNANPGNVLARECTTYAVPPARNRLSGHQRRQDNVDCLGPAGVRGHDVEHDREGVSIMVPAGVREAIRVRGRGAGATTRAGGTACYGRDSNSTHSVAWPRARVAVAIHVDDRCLCERGWRRLGK